MSTFAEIKNQITDLQILIDACGEDKTERLRLMSLQTIWISKFSKLPDDQLALG
jgi:hypothetical protein